MDVTVQYFEGCSNWKVTQQHLLNLADEPGRTFTVTYQQIETPEAAEDHGFRGSPTILIDGHDPFADPNAPVGLSCRIFQTDAGPAGSPTLSSLRAAISSTTSNSITT